MGGYGEEGFGGLERDRESERERERKTRLFIVKILLAARSVIGTRSRVANSNGLRCSHTHQLPLTSGPHPLPPLVTCCVLHEFCSRFKVSATFAPRSMQRFGRRADLNRKVNALMRNSMNHTQADTHTQASRQAHTPPHSCTLN